MRISRQPLLVGMIVLGSLGTAACTLVGWGLGAGVDAANVRRAPPDSVTRFPLGSRLRVRLRDGSVARGRFASLDSAAGPNGTVSRTLVLLVRRGQEPIRVPLDSVLRVERTTKGGRVGGAITGGVLDAILIIAMAACATQGGIMYC
jgi:hypothetical protein